MYCISPLSLTLPVIEKLLKLSVLMGHCIPVEIKYNLLILDCTNGIIL